MMKKIGMTSSNVENHYWECVTVNKCWVVNEDGKKPQEFDYDKYSFEEIPLSKRGLYHPNCHCIKTAISTPIAQDISLMLVEEKIEGTYRHKTDWMEKLGYPKNYILLFQSQFEKNLKSAYVSGKYSYTKHTTAGY